MSPPEATATVGLSGPDDLPPRQGGAKNPTDGHNMTTEGGRDGPSAESKNGRPPASGGNPDEAALPPIDGKAWSCYIRDGRAHFDRVSRSWSVFWRNANELVGLLHSVETDVVASLRLMQDPNHGDEDSGAFHRELWAALDQRLHNLVAAAVSLIDHTRPLIDFYENDSAFQHEFMERNAAVATSPRASFLRRLRNYLLHYGVAPMMQTMRLESTTTDQWDHLRVQLSAQELLKWSGWNEEQREFIAGFDGGPPLRDILVAYAEDMRDVYVWLFEQYQALHVPGEPPPHLTEGKAGWVKS